VSILYTEENLPVDITVDVSNPEEDNVSIASSGDTEGPELNVSNQLFGNWHFILFLIYK